MEGSTASSTSQPSSLSRHNILPKPKTDKPEKKALPTQSEETQGTQVTSLIGSNWPSLPSESGSPIPPGQKTKPESSLQLPWNTQQKNPEDYEKDRVGKYADYFKGNEILPIPENLQKNRTKDRFTGSDRFKVKAACRTKNGRVRRITMESGRPMPILLQKEFCDMGRPAPFQ